MKLKTPGLDDGDQAVRRNKRAETRSSVETGKEDKGRRIIVKPQKCIHNGISAHPCVLY